MVTLKYDGEFFSPKDVLECGQIFRYTPYKKGYFVLSGDKACYLFSENSTTFIECEDVDYFYNFFDLGRDYASIITHLQSLNIPVLTAATIKAKGLRLLNQQPEEMFFSFLISQNNNIPRIKKIIENICERLGEKREFDGKSYYTFPTVSKLCEANIRLFEEAGAGYRSDYIKNCAEKIFFEGEGWADALRSYTARELKEKLLTYRGVGAKVADCIALFAFKKTEDFPVDTWVEKLYREDFGGTIKDRTKICEYFCTQFKEYSGYAQQYLFYTKRANL